MVFCNKVIGDIGVYPVIVTILILIDGFLQLKELLYLWLMVEGHNPYFNRWFSAIGDMHRRTISEKGHNPYFNRWFSAIAIKEASIEVYERSQSLF